MERAENSPLFVLQLQENIKKLGKKNPWDIDLPYLEKLKSILSKIEIAGKNGIELSPRLWGQLSGRIYCLEPNEKDLTLTKELIHLIAQHMSPYSNGLAICLISIVSKKFPDFTNYFFDGKLTPKSTLKVIEKKFENKKENLTLDFGNADHLVETAKKMAENSDKEEIAFIIKPNFTMHLIPIFLRKREGEALEILITDSLGIDKDLLEKLKMKGVNAHVYTLSLQRQKDRGNCAVFAATDIIHYCKLKKQGIDLFEYAKEKASPLLQDNEDMVPEVDGDKLKVFEFNTLPSLMLKLSQNYKKIKKKQCKDIIDMRRGETLGENIEKYLFGLPKKKNNYHAGIKFARYVCDLALRTIEITKSPSQEITKRPSREITKSPSREITKRPSRCSLW